MDVHYCIVPLRPDRVCNPVLRAGNRMFSRLMPCWYVGSLPVCDFIVLFCPSFGVKRSFWVCSKRRQAPISMVYQHFLNEGHLVGIPFQDHTQTLVHVGTVCSCEVSALFNGRPCLTQSIRRAKAATFSDRLVCPKLGVPYLHGLFEYWTWSL